MTNLEFRDGLVDNLFSNNNNYMYGSLIETNIRFYKDCPNYPYIMTNGWEQQDPTILTYSCYAYQLRGRLLNTPKIKEVMDSAAMPLTFKIRDNHYLIGKGFLAHITNTNEFTESFKMLFVACIDSSRRRPRNISEVKFFISRDIYREEYKSVLPAVKDIMVGHTGDVILTSSIEDRVGDKIVFPSGGTIADRQKYKRAVMLDCIKGYFS